MKLIPYLLRRLKRLLPLCAGAAFLFPACEAQVDESGSGAVVEEVDYVDVRASGSGAAYRVFLDIPEEPAPESGYPVIYLLDGSWFFEIARSTATLLTAVGDMPPTVIVGIGYPEVDQARTLRFRDFTGEAEHPIPERMADWGIEPGGRDAFTAFLQDELPAIVAERTSINRDCDVLIGHSLGGIYALDVLFERPRAYTDFAIGDAAIWWDEYAVMDGEAAFLDGALDDVRGELFFAYSTAGDFEYLDRFAAFVERVRDAAGEDAAVSIKPYALDTHNSMVAGFLSTAMTRLPSCAREGGR